MSVLIETTLGDIVIDIFVKERPRCALNFLKLCKTKYFNMNLFHFVQRNFVVQTGDPTGTGKGGRSIFQTLQGDDYKFFQPQIQPKIKHEMIGAVSMVNNGNNLHGSQFLITLRNNLDSLDGAGHTVFGQVVEGLDVLTEIGDKHVDEEMRPYQDIRITHTVVIDDPLEDPPGLVIPDRSPDRPSEEEIAPKRIAADEKINPDEELGEEELKEKEEKGEARHNAQVLEIIGDIPDIDAKPAENVLFICKLNAITTSEDLEIIFSRFGQINSCEIICDYKTGASLQYAFVEFEDAEMCERAYEKMDNVLIDDRRIHVDFSQSVSRQKYPQFWNKMKKSGYAVPKEKEDGEKKKSHKRSDRYDEERKYNHYDKDYSRSRDLKHYKKENSEIRGGKHSKYSRNDRKSSYNRHHSEKSRYNEEGRDRSERSRKSSCREEERPSNHKKKSHKKREKNEKRKRSESLEEHEVRCGKHRKREQDRRH